MKKLILFVAALPLMFASCEKEAAKDVVIVDSRGHWDTYQYVNQQTSPVDVKMVVYYSDNATHKKYTTEIEVPNKSVFAKSLWWPLFESQPTTEQLAEIPVYADSVKVDYLYATGDKEGTVRNTVWHRREKAANTTKTTLVRPTGILDIKAYEKYNTVLHSLSHIVYSYEL